MKKNKNLLLALILSFSFTALLAQVPPPPNGGQTPSSGGNTPVGDGAPIGGGLFILLGLGAAYGGKKVYDYRKGKLAE